MKHLKTFLIMLVLVLVTACGTQENDHRTVVCIPVYGQSLALGEEAERLTDFDSLAAYANGRIVTHQLDHRFGFFDNNVRKMWLKRLVNYRKRSFELSAYEMARQLADQTGSDTLLCIFPGGRGATEIANLKKGTQPYALFMEHLATACQEAADRGWDFVVPAVCWMQGESDIVDYPEGDYQKKLTQMWRDMDHDIRQLTHQRDTIRFVCYQANSLTRAPQFQADRFTCRETGVPQAFVNLLSEESWCWASGPTYPYHCVGEKIHIDAGGQQAIGRLAARAVRGILDGAPRFRGVIPMMVEQENETVVVHFNTPATELAIDTIQVRKAAHYGFSVINPQNQDIIDTVSLDGKTVRIRCTQSPAGCKVRYAVNGDRMKSGNLHGPRGNLRDTQGNWAYQFDRTIGEE